MDPSLLQLVLFEFAFNCPPELIMAVGIIHLLDIKHPAIVLACGLALVLTDAYSNCYLSGNIAVIVAVVATLSYRIVLPFVLSRKPRIFTIIVILVMWCTTISVSIPIVSLYFYFFGVLPTWDEIIAHPHNALLWKGLQLVWETLSTTLLIYIFHRFDDIQHRVDGVGWLVLIPLVQAFFAFMMLVSLQFELNQITQLSLATMVSCFFTFIADIVFISLFLFWLTRERQRIEADTLLLELQSTRAHNELITQGIEDLSKIRHDTANHIQVIEHLCDNGQFDEARTHLTRLKDTLTQGESPS